MSRKTNLLLGLPFCLILAGCSLAPDYQQPQTGTAATWPVASAATATADGSAADIAWQDFFRDPVMRDLIGRALTNNADLAVATANVERARALYRVQRADQLPTVTAGAGATRQGTPAASSPTGSGCEDRVCSIARRVGSARAWNTASSWGDSYSIMWLNISAAPPTVNHLVVL